jgi:hypothetical protein
MHKISILVPVFVLATWTWLILLLIAARRLFAGVHPKEFELGESVNVPVKVSLPNRNYMNLLELPILFYVICLIVFTAQISTPYLLPLAWGYVALRVVHSLVHITYNSVLHRFVAFALSNFILVALWVAVGVAVFGSEA